MKSLIIFVLATLVAVLLLTDPWFEVEAAQWLQDIDHWLTDRLTDLGN